MPLFSELQLLYAKHLSMYGLPENSAVAARKDDHGRARTRVAITIVGEVDVGCNELGLATIDVGVTCHDTVSAESWSNWQFAGTGQYAVGMCRGGVMARL
jgi:hypothetical protein